MTDASTCQSFEVWHRLFHRLWSKAVNTPAYDKREWMALEQILTDQWAALTYRPRDAPQS